MDDLNIRNFRGGVAVVGLGVNQLVEKYQHEIVSLQKKHQFSPIQCPYHITLLSKREKSHCLFDDNLLQSYISSEEIMDFGIGGNIKKKNFFIVIVWPKGQKILQKLRLPTRNFHITISYQWFDDSDINHGFTSLFYDVEESVLSWSEKQINFFLYQHVEIENDYQTALRIGYILLDRYGSQEILLQIGDIYFSQGKYKMATLFFSYIFEKMNPSIQTRLKNKITQSVKHTETFGLFFRDELQEFQSIPRHLQELLWKNSRTINHSYHLIDYQRTPSLTNSISETRLYTYKSREMPRFFSSLVPDFIGIMSSPRSRQDIDALGELNFKYIVTLTREYPLPESWFQNSDLKNVFLPITDGKPPLISEMNWIIQFIMAAYLSNKRVLIHCGGGKGRAGTIAACYLTLFGSKPPLKRDKPVISAQEAINTLRSWRPGSVETPEQERFVSEWVSHCWKETNTRMDEPSGSEMEIVGDPNYLSRSKLIVLVGIPGSGKTWLSSALKKRNPQLFNIISRDDLHNKQDLHCLIQISKRNIIDQCNVDISSRKKWFDNKLHPVAITFQYPPELCQQRISERLNHPTIPIYGGERAIREQCQLFQDVCLGEGFHTIVILKNFGNVQDIIGKILETKPVPNHKFPRTSHAINLGAATTDDLVMSHQELISLESNADAIIVEEKVDGANLGFSLSGFDLQIRVQNRGHYVNCQSHLQFKNLDRWISDHYTDLSSILNRDPQYPERFVLYGEWMVLKHSILYQKLPDVFLVFDLYDRLNDSFYSRNVLSDLLIGLKLFQVPLIGDFKHQPDLHNLVNTPSKYYDGPVEGVYIRYEDRENRVTLGRAKVVRSDFLAVTTHWKKSSPQYNIISPNI